MIYRAGNSTKKNEKLRKTIVVIFIVGGLMAAGFMFGILGGFLGTASVNSNADSFEILGGAVIGTIIGYPIGMVIGLLVLKYIFRVSGSFLYGVIGSVAGVILIFILAEPLNLLDIYNNLVVYTFLLLPPVLATAGYFYLRIAGFIRSRGNS